ncbi:RNA 2',3'-cyclic phosphodiesterase [Desulfovulcanus sp.]
MRLFIGISVPETYQVKLQEIHDRWKSRFKSRLSWTRKGNWHLTMKFLGEVEETGLHEIKNALDKIHLSSVWLKGGQAGYFASRNVIRVLWLGLTGEVDVVEDWVRDIEEEFHHLGFSKENRPFHPHLTLARVKRFSASDPWSEFREYVSGVEWPEFKVQRINLWQSKLTPHGPVYQLVHSVEA